MLFGNSYYGIFGILVLIVDIFAILNILQSGADNLKKAIWVVVILALPLLGVILWYLFGPRGGRSGI